jgi:hypothetical protein
MTTLRKIEIFVQVLSRGAVRFVVGDEVDVDVEILDAILGFFLISSRKNGKSGGIVSESFVWRGELLSDGNSCWRAGLFSEGFNSFAMFLRVPGQGLKAANDNTCKY